MFNITQHESKQDNRIMQQLPHIFIVTLMLTFFGCQSQDRSAGTGYETIAGESLRDSETAREHNAIGLKAIEDGDMEEAEQAFKQALEADVMFGPAHNNLGKLYHTQELFYKAAWEYQYAIKLMPYHPEPKYNLGLVYESVGKLDEAITLYDQARTIQPDNPVLIGNYTRARIKRGDKAPEIRDLLTELLLKDTRPEWITWAKHRQAMLPTP